MQETGYETFSFYYDALTENVNYPARAAYLDGLVQKCHSHVLPFQSHAGSGMRHRHHDRRNGRTWL